MRGKFLESMPAPERRRFLQQASLLLAVPMVTEAFRFAFWEEIGGTAFAADRLTGPRYFLEVNFRDQWDFGPALVAPGVVDALGRSNDIAVLGKPTLAVNGLHISADALALREHADTVAILDACETNIGGIHHHEAANALRSPGRSDKGGPGRPDMAIVDTRPGTGGNEVLYSSSPTPALLHNHAARLADSSLRKGVLIRSSIRSGTHTFYHFEANLGQDARLERFYDRDTLLRAFEPPPGVPTTNLLTEHSATLTSIIRKIDARYLNELQKQARGPAHDASLGRIDFSNSSEVLDLRLSANELSQWRAGVPGQFNCDGDNADACKEVSGKFNLGEMFGYVAKMFTSGQVRTAAIDFDYHDVHTRRTDSLLKTQAIQTALPLARLIAALKAAGIYDRTVIAMYTLDGSRPVLRDGDGYFTKNSVVLAGGGIRGGYYGDIRLRNGNWFLHPPGADGAPVADNLALRMGDSNSANANRRVQGRDVYKTVAKAAGIADALVNSFPDVTQGRVLSYLLRG
ncbi:MAG: DUF1501 domain-containing protein [Silvanigrellales bacterium]|nr:DUF1501 domain-containing protein [Silvanigrellales bacterium]